MAETADFPAVPHNLRELHAATSTPAATVAWLRAHGLLARAMTCDCGEAMQERAYTRSIDGVTWRCGFDRCRRTKNIRRGSFFEQ